MPTYPSLLSSPGELSLKTLLTSELTPVILLMDRSAERRFGPFAIGESREILHRRFKIIGTTTEAASFTTAPIVFMDYGSAQERSEILTVELKIAATPGR